MIVRSIKALRLFNHILLGIVLLVLTGAVWNNGSRRVKKTKQWWLGRITRLLGMTIEIEGELPPPSNTGYLFVCNHISWTDIPVIGGLTQINFLSKAEVKSWPLVGHLAHTTGTLFIQRGSGDTSKIARQIGDYLNEGRSVLFFPEGTTSDGSTVGRFHRKLFRACEFSDTRVCPIAIHYEVEGVDHNPVAFIGDDELTSHIWKLLSFSRIRVKVTLLPARTLDIAALDAHVEAVRQDILGAVELHHQARRLSTSAQSPGASSPAGLRDEAASC